MAGEALFLSDASSDEEIAVIGTSRPHPGARPNPLPRARSTTPLIIGSTSPRSPSPVFMRESAPAAIEVLSQTLESDTDTDGDDLEVALAVTRKRPGATTSYSVSGRYTASASVVDLSPERPGVRKASTSRTTMQASTSSVTMQASTSRSTMQATTSRSTMQASTSRAALQASTSYSMVQTSTSRSESRASSSRSALLPLDDGHLNSRQPKKRRKESCEGSDEETAEQKAERAAQARKEKLEAKEAEKAAKQRARDEAKAAKEAEKSYQAKLKDANRLRVSKTEALREIEVHLAHDLSLPTSVIAGALPEIKARLEESRSKLVFLSEDDTVVNSTMRFRRRVKSAWDETTKRFAPLSQERYEWEPMLVVLTSVDAIVDQIAEDENLFIRWLRDIRLTMGIKDEQVFLLVRGMAKYHSKSVSVVNKSYRENATASLAGGATSMRKDRTTRVTKEMVESELLQAQVAERIFVSLVDETVDLEDWVFNVAADVALRPYKRLQKSHLSFAAPDGQRKAHDATDALEYMLQEIPGITPAAAASISQSHPTFRELMEAYEEAEGRGRSAAEGMLEGCEIGRLVTGAASSRRIGKAMSKRVYDVMRTADPLALF